MTQPFQFKNCTSDSVWEALDESFDAWMSVDLPLWQAWCPWLAESTKDLFARHPSLYGGPSAWNDYPHPLSNPWLLHVRHLLTARQWLTHDLRASAQAAELLQVYASRYAYGRTRQFNSLASVWVTHPFRPPLCQFSTDRDIQTHTRGFSVPYVHLEGIYRLSVHEPRPWKEDLSQLHPHDLAYYGRTRTPDGYEPTLQYLIARSSDFVTTAAPVLVEEGGVTTDLRAAWEDATQIQGCPNTFTPLRELYDLAKMAMPFPLATVLCFPKRSMVYLELNILPPE